MICHRLSRFVIVAGLFVAAGGAWPLRALAMDWKISEIYSNADGTVQFIELLTNAANDFAVNSLSLTATSGGTPAVFTLNHNLSGPATSTNRSILIATPGFNLLEGAPTPDFGTLPTHFFNPHATTLSFDFAGLDALTFSGSIFPKDGIRSLKDHFPDSPTPHLAAELNSPTNFLGIAGSIDLSTGPLPADFDGSGSVNSGDLFLWSFGFGITAGAQSLDGDTDEDGDVDGADFIAWQRQLGSTQASAVATLALGAVPEPGSAVLALSAAVGICRWRRLVRRRGRSSR